MTGHEKDDDEPLRDPALSALYQKSRQVSASPETDAKILAHAASAAASAAMRKAQRQKPWGQIAAAAAILLVVGSVGTWMIEREDVPVTSLARSERVELEAPAQKRENIALNDQPTPEAFQATAPAAPLEKARKSDSASTSMAAGALPEIAEKKQLADRAQAESDAAAVARSPVAASEPAPSAIALAAPKEERLKSEPARKAKAAAPAAVAESTGIGALKSAETAARMDELAQSPVEQIKQMPVHAYDATLPSLALEAWLQSIVPSGMTIAWTAVPVRCHGAEAGAMAAQCIEVAIVRETERVALLHFESPGSPSQAASEKKTLVYGEASEGGGMKPIRTLSELPARLR